MILLIFCLSTFAYSTAASWNNLTANIAVVEYRPTLDIQPVAANTAKYIEIIQSISDLDLVIFPEDTLLAGHETSTEIRLENPCDLDTYPEFMKNLSCAARASKTYVVVNLVEKSKCDQSTSQSKNCKNEGFYFYNTDVAFDRDGTIINRYRKFNLFGEPSMDKPETPEDVIIKTDFGVNFGIFTCFDILFKSPAQNLLSDGVDAILFPSMWFSELPFLTAIQAQQMFAQAHDIRVFASGANEPLVGSGGSGVYIGSKGAVLGGYVAEGGSQTFLFKSTNGSIPTPPSQNVDVLGKAMDDFNLISDNSIPDWSSKIMNTTGTSTTTVLCHFGADINTRMCCEFSYKLSLEEPQPDLNRYTYLLVAYAGVRTYTGVYNGGIELCAVIACLDSSLSSCGQRFPDYDTVQWPVTFEELKIRATFDKNENKTQFPNSLLSSIRPIQTSETLWNSADVQGKDEVERTFSIVKPQNRLLTFGILGRNFALDAPNDGDDGYW